MAAPAAGGSVSPLWAGLADGFWPAPETGAPPVPVPWAPQAASRVEPAAADPATAVPATAAPASLRKSLRV